MTTYRNQFTYSAATTAFNPPATPTNVAVINGSATNNIYVLKAGISTTQTAAGSNQWYLDKCSTPNLGGTFAAPTMVPYDSNNPAATASVFQYTANPATPATLVGAVWSGYVDSPIVTTVGVGNAVVEVNFMDMFGQPLTLLSANESLNWNFNGAALPGGLTVIAYFVWIESPKT